ncbi:hypothetical protein AB0K15_21105 [Amycolatopsis sp. NPDC049253]|jgi:hypothetical protein|uniref:hypothetical protein n=1 Tax=Amycolatopsis sp. NPDC049253 TaxID=3155274 RepID=UPI003413E709
MSEQNITPEPEETETPEVEAHSAEVLGLQKLEDNLGFNQPSQAFSCSSCAGASC